MIGQLTFAAGIESDEAAASKLDKLEALIARATDVVTVGVRQRCAAARTGGGVMIHNMVRALGPRQRRSLVARLAAAWPAGLAALASGAPLGSALLAQAVAGGRLAAGGAVKRRAPLELGDAVPQGRVLPLERGILPDERRGQAQQPLAPFPEGLDDCGWVGEGVRNPDRRAQRHRPLDHGGGRRGGEIEIARQRRELALDRLDLAVEGEHVGHDDGVDQPVVQVEDAGTGVRERVHAADPLLERGATDERGRHHVGAGGEVGAVRDRARQRRLDQSHAFERQAVGHRMMEGATIGLEIVRERVHPGRGRHVGGQAQGQLGIGDAHLGHEPSMEQGLFHLQCFIDDGGRATDLGTRAGGRRHAHHRGDAVRSNAARESIGIAEIGHREVPQRPLLPGHEGDRLAGVERAAAADRDDPVVATIAVGGEPGLDRRPDRIGPHRGEKAGAKVGALQVLDRPRHDIEAGQSRIGDDQRPRDAGPTTGRGEPANAAGSEHDMGREVPGRGQRLRPVRHRSTFR